MVYRRDLTLAVTEQDLIDSASYRDLGRMQEAMLAEGVISNSRCTYSHSMFSHVSNVLEIRYSRASTTCWLKRVLLA